MVRGIVIPAIIAVILVFAATNSPAQVYEWIDADGKKQFSDQPPPEPVEVKVKEYEIMNIDSNMPPPIVIDETRAKRTSQEAQARQEHRAADCQKAEEYLKRLKGRVSFSDDESGESVYVSEKERVTRVSKLTEKIKKQCRS